MRASSATPFVTLTSGISRRKCWTSPRPRNSMPTTSLIGSSAGTSSMNRRVASSIRALASSAIWCCSPSQTVVARCGVSDLMTLQKLAPDDHALNLRGPLADQQKRRITVQALDLILLGVAVAAVDPQALLDAEAPRLGGEQLGHAGLEVRTLAGVLQAR